MRRLLPLAIIVVLVFSAVAQTPDYSAMRKQAFEYFDHNQLTQAYPLFEQLAGQFPNDKVIFERYGYCLLTQAKSGSNDEVSKELRVRARRALLHAQELGDDSNLLKVLLEGIAEDGSTTAFSSNAAANEAMDKGETAFTAGRLEEAIEDYRQAHLLEPTLYDAPLYMCDSYFKLKQPANAVIWCDVAIQIDPDRETGYRYEGDALMAAGDMTKARDRFIQAIVANPYVQRTWIGLKQWADDNHATLGHPRIESPNKLEQKGANRTNITINASILDSPDGSSAWMMYEISRAAWNPDLFKKNFPKEPTYRHTMAEEVWALGTVADSFAEAKKDHKVKQPNPMLETLLSLKQEGLLESYVLLARADDGIVKDYVAYRTDHRDLLAKYIREYVIHQDTK